MHLPTSLSLALTLLTPLSASVLKPRGTAPYAQGTCAVHIKQRSVSGDASGLYDLEVAMTDNDNNQIGYTQMLGGNNGYSGANPLQFQSKLEDVLTCLPEQAVIFFTLGAQAWRSDNFNGNFPGCNVGVWDDKSQTRQMDCQFVCFWGGGLSSDGTGSLGR